MIDGSASPCLDLIKTVGTLEIGFLDVLGSPPSTSSLWLGFALVIGLTALLYMIFWVILSKS